LIISKCFTIQFANMAVMICCHPLNMKKDILWSLGWS